MLPSVELSSEEIECIADSVPGAAATIQDIYPLAPLQEGILFHHMMAEHGDRYLLIRQMSFETRSHLDRYLAAMRSVIDRHDILRTAVLWKVFSEPVQVVMRKASLVVEEISLDPADGSVAKQMYARFDPKQYRIDLWRAPLLEARTAFDPENGRWLVLLLSHHLTNDHETAVVMQDEMQARLLGSGEFADQTSSFPQSCGAGSAWNQPRSKLYV
jgi:hypothetical protein